MKIRLSLLPLCTILICSLFISNSAAAENEPRTRLRFAPDILLMAAEKGDLGTTRKALRAGVNANVKRKDGITSLHIAVEHNRIEITRLLLAYEANPNAQDNYRRNPLSIAVHKGNSEIVELLLAYEANPNAQDAYGKDPLSIAVNKGDIKIVQLLLAYEANINMKKSKGTANHLQLAIRKGHKHIARVLATHPNTLLNATEEGDLETVRQLLRAGATANVQRKDHRTTPLHIAVNHNHAAIVELLLAYEANPNAKDALEKDPLSIAVCKNNAPLVRLLLNYDANVNAMSTDGVNHFHLALYAGHTKIAKMIINHPKFDSNAKDVFGYTPLYWANFFKNKTVIQTLHLRNARDLSKITGNHSLSAPTIYP